MIYHFTLIFIENTVTVYNYLAKKIPLNIITERELITIILDYLACNTSGPSSRPTITVLTKSKNNPCSTIPVIESRSAANA